MSHRKFEAPRHGSLGFLPRKRCRRSRGKVKAFPQEKGGSPHFTAFIGFKAGMTHVVRDIYRPKSRLHKLESLEAVTVIDCPRMRIVGLVGYVETPRGLRSLTTVWASHLSDEFRRRMYKNWYRSKHKAFTHHMDNYSEEDRDEKLALIKKHCTFVRAICHTQPSKVPMSLKKAQVIEIQINGGSVAEKVDFIVDKFETEMGIKDIFTEGECIDTIAITKGKGFEGVTTRWGTNMLPRKTNKGLRKVACIGAWHPANVQYTVARAGQNGYHHRTEINKRIYRLRTEGDDRDACTELDLTAKKITPMGGFPHYGEINNDWIMIRGCCPGVVKRPITLRKSLVPAKRRDISVENIALKFIDTSSKMGHGRFQVPAEKAAFYSL